MSDDPQLKSLLEQWPAPAPPASLEARLHRARMPWYRRMMTASIPVPVAVAFSLLLALGAWKASSATSAGCLSWVPITQQNCSSASVC